jgi:hypothetical protein
MAATPEEIAEFAGRLGRDPSHPEVTNAVAWAEREGFALADIEVELDEERPPVVGPIVIDNAHERAFARLLWTNYADQATSSFQRYVGTCRVANEVFGFGETAGEVDSTVGATYEGYMAEMRAAQGIARDKQPRLHQGWKDEVDAIVAKALRELAS